MLTRTLKSYWPHIIIVVSIMVVGFVIFAQWQNQSKELPTNQVSQSTEPARVLPSNKSQEEIEATVLSLQAQPTMPADHVLVYSGPNSELKNLVLPQNSIIAITNATPNEVLVSFSSGSSMTLGTDQTLENLLGVVGSEVISIKEGADLTKFTVIVDPSL